MLQHVEHIILVYMEKVRESFYGNTPALVIKVQTLCAVA